MVKTYSNTSALIYLHGLHHIEITSGLKSQSYLHENSRLTCIVLQLPTNDIIIMQW